MCPMEDTVIQGDDVVRSSRFHITAVMLVVIPDDAENALDPQYVRRIQNNHLKVKPVHVGSIVDPRLEHIRKTLAIAMSKLAKEPCFPATFRSHRCSKSLCVDMEP